MENRFHLEHFSQILKAITVTMSGDFKGGNTLYVFNLNAELTDGDHTEPTRRGAVRIECRFSQALAQPITCILLSEYDNLILIDKERNVSLDYLV